MKSLSGSGSRDRKSTRLNSSHVRISYAVFCLIRCPPPSTLFPYTTLFRSNTLANIFTRRFYEAQKHLTLSEHGYLGYAFLVAESFYQSLPDDLKQIVNETADEVSVWQWEQRSEEHTSELQSRPHLVCRLLLDPLPPAIYTLSLHDALPI